KVALEIPWRRQTSSVLAPASCSRSTPMICSSLKRLPFIARLLFSGDGLYLISAEFSGCRPLFIHWKTRFKDAEWEGFPAGSPAKTNLVAVRIIRSQDMKLFRMGPTPVLRGTAYGMSRNRALLWTMGYILRLQTYPGREVPN